MSVSSERPLSDMTNERLVAAFMTEFTNPVGRHAPEVPGRLTLLDLLEQAGPGDHNFENYQGPLVEILGRVAGRLGGYELVETHQQEGA